MELVVGVACINMLTVASPSPWFRSAGKLRMCLIDRPPPLRSPRTCEAEEPAPSGAAAALAASAVVLLPIVEFLAELVEGWLPLKYLNHLITTARNMSRSVVW